MPPGHLAAHVDDCPYNKAVCNKDCGFEGSKSQMKEHDCLAYLKTINRDLTKSNGELNEKLKNSNMQLEQAQKMNEELKAKLEESNKQLLKSKSNASKSKFEEISEQISDAIINKLSSTSSVESSEKVDLTVVKMRKWQELCVKFKVFFNRSRVRSAAFEVRRWRRAWPSATIATTSFAFTVARTTTATTRR